MCHMQMCRDAHMLVYMYGKQKHVSGVVNLVLTECMITSLIQHK